MHDAVRVRVVQCFGYLAQNFHGASAIRTRVLQQRAHVAAAEQAHAHPRNAIVGAAGVNGNDRGVLEPGDDARLLLEAPAKAPIMEKLRRQNLQRDRAVERRVVHFVDRRHPTPAEQRANPERAEHDTRQQQRARVLLVHVCT